MVYWFLQSFTNVLLICRSIRLQTRSSAASVRYLGHTPITARQGDELCRGNIFMEYSHFFECYFAVILRVSPGRGLKQQAAVTGRWQLGWLGLKVDLSSLYANALAPRQSSVGDALWRAPALFFWMTSPFIQACRHHWENMFGNHNSSIKAQLAIYTMCLVCVHLI